MRDREQRLRWIEKLISGGSERAARSNALVVPTPAGDMAIAFDAIDEVVPASGVRPFAFLPPEFCGVLHRGAELVPVVDAGGGATGHVVVVKAKGGLLGLKFHGTPSVANLNEAELASVALRMEQRFDGEGLPVLDVEAAIEALLELD